MTTTFTIELENKENGNIHTSEMQVHRCLDAKEFITDYCSKMRRAYLGAKTVWVVSRMNVKS